MEADWMTHNTLATILARAGDLAGARRQLYASLEAGAGRRVMHALTAVTKVGAPVASRSPAEAPAAAVVLVPARRCAPPPEEREADDRATEPEK